VESILLELALLFALCVAAGVVFQRLRLPPIVGFLAIGALVGPHSIGLVQHEETVQHLAEVGVVVLLFAVGMEVPLDQLARLRRTMLLGGGLQIVGTVLAAAAIGWLSGLTWSQGLFLGFLLSLSSTAALSKVLVDHGEFSAPHGRLAMSIAIAQDLAVVPMILLMPMLVGSADAGSSGSGIVRTLENLAILVVVLSGAHFLVPRLLAMVGRTRSRELFVLTLATLCLSMAVVTSQLGMSMALGAFLAGILLADSEFRGQAAAEVEPFRDALASLFFVSIGMLFDGKTIAASPWLVAAALLAVFAGKAGVVVLAARALGQPGWVRLRAGLLLAQVGEFSFVLAQVGGGTEVLSAHGYKIFLVVAVLSIASTPLLHEVGRRLVRRSRGREGAVARADDRLQDHAIVVGYGPTGRTVVQALQALHLPVVALEMNVNTVRNERAHGAPVEAGDATRASVLKKLGIDGARILVLAINDTDAARRIAQLARHLAPQVHVIARAVYIGEVDAMKAAGAHEVVPQELEASVEILVRALRRFLVADDEIGRRVTAVRQTAGVDKTAAVARLEAARIAEFVPGLGVGVHRVARGASLDGRTLAEAGVRRLTACTVVAVRRGQQTLPAIDPDTRLEAGDAVVVLGPEARLADVAALFHAPVDSEAPRPVPASTTVPADPQP
jgi:CPA2 family monovalent cation:H+ antiporter-2